MPSLRGKTFDFEGRTYTSTFEFAKAFNLRPSLAWLRVNHGIMDGRLPLDANLHNPYRPIKGKRKRMPMYVRTFMNGWREWKV